MRGSRAAHAAGHDPDRLCRTQEIADPHATSGTPGPRRPLAKPRRRSLDGSARRDLRHSRLRLVHTLMEHDLVDELRLIVYPVVLGAGERLFGETSIPKSMRLLDTRTVGDRLAYERLREA
ncbi:MAG: dihydrofolate reductase family protein [Solirubrobacteraceae bacterium]